MSQGELHALALSLFLPRATSDDSPFRFVVIDDPVQAMDPARVDGLARVLAETARTHQVVVFSHDDRLPESLRRQRMVLGAFLESTPDLFTDLPVAEQDGSGVVKFVGILGGVSRRLDRSPGKVTPV